MRTEVKIVAILAFVLIVVGVWWFMFHSPQGKEVATNEQVNSSPSNVVVTEPKPGETKTPSSITPSGSTAKVPSSAPAAPATSDGGNWWEHVATPAPASAPTRMTAATPAAATTKPSLADAGSSHSYKVKTGDTYWSIAKAEYGDGNLHGIIEAANPKAPSNRLAANMTITIPAKPAVAAAAAVPGAAAGAATGGETSALAAEGTTGTDPATGKRYYIVKKGDNGLWSIAQNTLGDGRLWTKIKAANEGLQETNLHPGQKLWLPAGAEVKPTAAKPAVAGASTGGTPAAGSTGSTAGATGSTAAIPGLIRSATAVSSPANPVTPAARNPSGTGAPASTNLPGGKTFD